MASLNTFFLLFLALFSIGSAFLLDTEVGSEVEGIINFIARVLYSYD